MKIYGWIGKSEKMCHFIMRDGISCMQGRSLVELDLIRLT